MDPDDIATQVAEAMGTAPRVQEALGAAGLGAGAAERAALEQAGVEIQPEPAGPAPGVAFSPEQRGLAERVQRMRGLMPSGMPEAIVTEQGIVHGIEGPGAAGGGAGPAGPASTLEVQPGPVGLGRLMVATHERQEAAREAAAVQQQEQAMLAVEAERQALRERLAAEHYSEIAARHLDGARQQVGQLGELLNAMQTRRIDPQRMWSNMGAASRFGVAMSMAGGYAAHVLTGVATGSQELVMQAIENDLQAQLADSQNLQAVAAGRGNLVQSMRDLYQDETSALQAGRAILIEEAKARLAAIAAMAQSARARSTLQDTIASLEQQQVLTINELLLNRIRVGFRGDAGLIHGAFEAAVEGRAREVEQAQLQAAMAIHAASLPPPGPPAPPDIEAGELPAELGFPAPAGAAISETAPAGAAISEAAPAGAAISETAPAGAPSGARAWRGATRGQPLGPFPLEYFDTSRPELLAQVPPLPPGYEMAIEGTANGPQYVRYVATDRFGRADVRSIGGGPPISTAESRALTGHRAPPISMLPEGSSILPGAEELYREWSTSEQGRAFVGLIGQWPEIEEDFQIILDYYQTSGWLGAGIRRPVTRSVDEAMATEAAKSVLGHVLRIMRSGPSDALAEAEAERMLSALGGAGFDLEDSRAVLMRTIRRMRGAIRGMARINGGLVLNMEPIFAIPEGADLSGAETGDAARGSRGRTPRQRAGDVAEGLFPGGRRAVEGVLGPLGRED